MLPLIALIALIATPFLLAVIFRVSAVLLFASLMAGSLFVRYLGDSVGLTTAAFIKNPQAGLYVQAVLTVLPLLLTLLIARRSLSSSKLLLNILPLLSIAFATAVLVLPQLPSDAQGALFGTYFGSIIKQSQDDIIGLMILFNLALIWISFRSRSEEHHGKHHR